MTKACTNCCRPDYGIVCTKAILQHTQLYANLRADIGFGITSSYSGDSREEGAFFFDEVLSPELDRLRPPLARSFSSSTQSLSWSASSKEPRLLLLLRFVMPGTKSGYMYMMNEITDITA